MALFTNYMAKGKKAVRRVGRPSRDDLGLEPIKSVTTAVEESVLDAVIAKFGSVANGLRYLAKHSPIQKAS